MPRHSPLWCSQVISGYKSGLMNVCPGSHFTEQIVQSPFSTQWNLPCAGLLGAKHLLTAIKNIPIFRHLLYAIKSIYFQTFVHWNQRDLYVLSVIHSWTKFKKCLISSATPHTLVILRIQNQLAIKAGVSEFKYKLE